MSRFLQFEALCIGLTLCILALVYLTGSGWWTLAVVPGGAFAGWIMAVTE